MGNVSSQNNNKARDMNSRMIAFCSEERGLISWTTAGNFNNKNKKMLVRRKLVGEYAQMRLKYI